MTFKAVSKYLVAALLLAMVGCSREDEQAIVVQQVPKQPPPQLTTPAWKVPEGWTRLPAQEMRFASFAVSAEHPELVVTVSSLDSAGGGGQLLLNVNRWEGQVGLPPTPEADLPKIVKMIESNGNRVAMVDLTGVAKPDAPKRILGAILPRPGKTWFFKLEGAPKALDAYQTSFEAFVRSVTFDPSDVSDGVAAAPLPVAALAESITYTAPENWIKNGHMDMRVVSFHIGSGDNETDVIVSALPSTSGSREDNINRWRGQVGMPPLQAGEAQASKDLKIGGVDGALFDLTGPKDNATPQQRLIVAWVPKGDQWWFFKIFGPADVVNKEQAHYEDFLKSVQFASEKP